MIIFQIIKKEKDLKKLKKSKKTKKDKTPKQCPMCAKTFKGKMWIPTHLKLCKKYFKYLDRDKCLLCGKLCTTMRGFFNHVKKAHDAQIENEVFEEPKEEKLKLECLECKIQFNDQASFLAHLRVFHSQKSKIEKVLLNKLSDVKCSICKGLIKPQDYEGHIGTCGKPPLPDQDMVDPEAMTTVYACPLCHGKFPLRTSAEMHVLKFHKLSLDIQAEMGIKIKEINL